MAGGGDSTPQRRRPPPGRLSPQALADARGGAVEGLDWLGRQPESKASPTYRLLRLLARAILFGAFRFHITTSGNFSDPAMLCSIQEMGVDRILFAVDFPYVENKPATAWMDRISLCAEDKAKILSGNVKRLLRM